MEDQVWGCDKTQGFGVGAVNLRQWLKNIWGIQCKIWVILVGFCYRFILASTPSLWWQNYSSVSGAGRAAFSCSWDILWPALWQKGEVRESLLHLLFLKCLKMINKPKWGDMSWTPSKSCYTPNDTLFHLVCELELHRNHWLVSKDPCHSDFAITRLYHGVKYRSWARWCLMFHIDLTFHDAKERAY